MIKYFCDMCGAELTEGNYGEDFLQKVKDGYIAQLQIGSENGSFGDSDLCKACVVDVAVNGTEPE